MEQCILELDKFNRNLRKIGETITIDKNSSYYDCINIADTTSSLRSRSDLDELKDYLKEKEKETNKKKRRISVRIRL